jgi:Arc/MetJ-type ribon-helix-helix transcriptional regulator
MTIPIPTEFAEFVSDCMASGRFATEEDLAKAALSLLRDREEILQDIDEGLADFESGNFSSYRADEGQGFLADIQDESARLGGQER